MSFGFTLLNDSNRPVTLDAVAAIDESGPSMVLRSAVLHHPRSVVYANTTYPPSDVATAPHPLKGWVVKPHENDDNLILEVHVRRGIWVMRELRLAYHADSHHYAVTFPFTFEVCTPFKKWAKRGCPQPQ